MLRTFAYVRPGSVSEALKQLEERRGADPRRRHRPARLSARRGVRGPEARQPREDRRAPRHDRGARRRAAHWRADHGRRDRRPPGHRGEVRGARAGGVVGRQPAAAQPGHHWRQPVPAAALLVLPRRLRTARARAARCATPSAARTSTTASSAAAPASIVHPSDTAPALIALDAKVRLVGPKGARVDARSSSSSCCPRRTRRARPCSSPAKW